MIDKRQNQSKANRNNQASETTPTKGGGVLSGLALTIALVASAVSAYLYTELQKYSGKVDEQLQSTTKGIEADVSKQIESITAKLGSIDADVNTRLESAKTDANESINSSQKQMTSKIDSVTQHINSVTQQIDSVTQSINTRIDEQSEVSKNTTQSSVQLLAEQVSTNFNQFSESTAQAQQTQAAQTQTQFDSLNAKIAQLTASLEETTDVAMRGQREWTIAEIRYLLRTASYRVDLAGDTKSAVLALRSASDRIFELNDISYSAVREQISEEVAELRQAGIPDLEGIAFELQKLSKRADTLPLPPSNMEVMIKEVKENPKTADASAMAEQLLESIKDLVKVEKSDGTPLIRPGKPSKKQLTASEGLRLNLQAARLSALRRDQESYLLQMNNAEEYVKNNYHQEDNLTKAYLEDLLILKAQKIVPSVKKLGQALTLFNEIHSKRGEN